MLLFKKSKKNKTIAIDFDGVLHDYTAGWTGVVPEGKPIKGSLEFVENVIALGYDVVVFSARLNHEESRKEMSLWFKKYGFPDLDTSLEKPNAEIYVDDRGYRFEGDFTEVFELIKNNKMNPWYRK